MTKVDDIFGDLALNKPLEVEIEGKNLELDMRVDDLHSLMAVGQKQEMAEEDVEQLTDTLRTILYRTYLPHYDTVRNQEPDELSKEKQRENEEAKEYIEGLLLRHYLDLFIGISNELGWQDDIEGVPQQGNFPENPQS